MWAWIFAIVRGITTNAQRRHGSRRTELKPRFGTKMKLLGPRKTLALCLFLLTSFVNSFSMPSSSSQCSSWKPLNPDSLVSAPCLIEQTLCQPNDDAPQLAASVEYATAVLDAWRADDDDDGSWCDLEWCDVTYQQDADDATLYGCLLYTSPSPRDRTRSRMPSSA